MTNQGRETAANIRAAYREAREELLQRMLHRDRAIIAYLAATGAVFAAVYSSSNFALEVLFISIPMAIGAAMIVHQHSSSIVSIVSYIRLELDPAMTSNGSHVPLWEMSEALKKADSNNVAMRSIGEFLVIGIPVLFVVAINFECMTSESGLCFVGWWTSVGSLLFLVKTSIDMYFTSRAALAKRQ